MSSTSEIPGRHSSRIEALIKEIMAARAELAATAVEDDKIRETLAQLMKAVESNDDRKVNVLQRMDQAEYALQQLQQSISSSHGASSSYARDLTVRSLGSGGIALPTSHHGGSSRSGEPVPSPFAELPSRTSSRATAIRPEPSRARDKGKQKAASGSENLELLPMVIEAILADHLKQEKKNSLRSCNHALKIGNKITKCKRDAYDVECFRDDHYQYCWEHCRIITGDHLACNHEQKCDCVRVFWEDDKEWEQIVHNAVTTDRVGKKGVPFKDLREALLPPSDFPQAYATGF